MQYQGYCLKGKKTSLFFDNSDLVHLVSCLDLVDDILTFDYLTEDSVYAIKMWLW